MTDHITAVEEGQAQQNSIYPSFYFSNHISVGLFTVIFFFLLILIHHSVSQTRQCGVYTV